MYSAYGVTTVVSLGQQEDDQAAVITLRDEQDQIDLDRARVYTSGPSTRGHKSPDEARQAVNQLADRGVDRIKFHLQGGDDAMSGETVAGLIDQAHVRGLRASAHIFTLEEARKVVNGGIDVVAHSVRDQEVDEALITAMKIGNVGYVPTLTRELSVFAYETTPAFFREPFFLRGMSLYGDEVTSLSDAEYQQRVRTNTQAQAIKAALAQANRNLKILSVAGVPIALGTDSGASVGRWQGYFEHVEMEMMVEAGMTPMQTLVAATSAAAAVSNLDQVGTIAPGKAADFLVLNANPLDDIRNTREIDSVWMAGRRLTNSN
jgi:imidazolonepropionase-like amidohydrolase